MTGIYIILLILTIICVIITYILVFKPEKDARFTKIISRLNILLQQTLLIVTLLISSIPSILVIQDRWLGYGNGLRTVDYIWWDSLISLPLVYPRYFLYIFLLTALVWLIVFFWQNSPSMSFSVMDIGQVTELPAESSLHNSSQKTGNWFIGCALGVSVISAGIAIATGRIPGWELILALGIYGFGWARKGYDSEEIKQYFQSNGAILLSASIFVVSLCGALYALFGEAQHVLIFYILFILSAINLYKYKRDLPAIYWISVLSLVALTWKIDGWEYVVIGDEYSFYVGVREILEKRTLWELINTTFNGNFVFGTHPYFSSYIQSLCMTVFGDHNFGWRFSNPFLVSASLFLYYYFFKSFVTRHIALTTVILIGFSHYLLSFAKIGYNNLQAFFALGLVLSVFAWALKSMKLASFSFLGLSMGLCFYIYPAALYILPLPILGLLIYLPPVKKKAIKCWAWALLSSLLVIYPLFVQPKYWQEKIPGTFLYVQADNLKLELIQNTTNNLFYSVFSYLYIPQETHYVSTGYMDPLSSVFIMIGTAVLARALLRRYKHALFLLLGFLILFTFVGLTHGRPFPPTTRMFLLLPWHSLFSVYGIEWFTGKFSSLFSTTPSVVLKRLLAITVTTIVLVNLFNAYVIDIRRSAKYHTMPPIFIKTARQINENRNIPPKSYYFVAEEGWNTTHMIFHQWVYLVPDSPRQLVSLYLEEGHQLPASARTVVSERDVIVIVRSTIDSKIMMLVDAQLKEWGKFMCDIKNEKGVTQFQLWHSGDIGWLCE